MKTSNKRLLATFALVAATLCVSSTEAGRAGNPTSQTARKSVRIKLAVPASFDLDTRDGTIVGLTTVAKDGTRKALKQQSRPTCATSCPAGQKLSCWEDEEQLMSICVCGGGGSPDDFRYWLSNYGGDF
jgi:hypothetical protein